MIRITRKTFSHNTFSSWPYKIFIDDVYRGDIHGNDTVEYPVENGYHIIYAKIGRSKSNIINIMVNDTIIELETGENSTSSITIWGLLEMLYTSPKEQRLWIGEKNST